MPAWRPAPGGGWLGDPTETALADVAANAGLDKAALDTEWPRVHEKPFDADRKRMTTVHRTPQGFVAYTKGAPESVIPLCKDISEGVSISIDQAGWLARADALASQGLRVLAVARRSHERLPEADAEIEAIESCLSFLGLVGLINPPRPEAAAAVRECMTAGITTVMITGDHPATARAIALGLGIVDNAGAQVLTGADLATMDEETPRSQVQPVRIYARVDPAQKIRIVAALQAQCDSWP